MVNGSQSPLPVDKNWLHIWRSNFSEGSKRHCLALEWKYRQKPCDFDPMLYIEAMCETGSTRGCFRTSSINQCANSLLGNMLLRLLVKIACMVYDCFNLFFQGGIFRKGSQVQSRGQFDSVMIQRLKLLPQDFNKYKPLGY